MEGGGDGGFHLWGEAADVVVVDAHAEAGGRFFGNAVADFPQADDA